MVGDAAARPAGLGGLAVRQRRPRSPPTPGYLEKPDARVTTDELEAFVARQRYWVADWARFAGAGAIADQVRFDREWSALRRYAAERGVKLFGDVPIYVARDGADEAAHPGALPARARRRRAARRPVRASASSGATRSTTGARSARRATAGGSSGCAGRSSSTTLRASTTSAASSRTGRCPRATRRRGAATGGAGPAPSLFDAAERELGPLSLVAEDLGVITKPVEELRDKLGMPGMVVMQFAFDGPPVEPAPHREPPAATASSTRRRTTATPRSAGGGRSRSGSTATGLPGVEPNWELIELALSSRADLAIVQAQDVLGLGSEARMNMPGTSEGNWAWRSAPGS